jgi:single-stranded DNA-specific DHH superfamily exonuclease
VKTLGKSEIVERTIGPAIEHIKKIKATDRVVIFHHNDCDGCCSAAVMGILMKKLFGATPRLVPADVEEETLDFRAIEKTCRGYQHLIVLDFPAFKISDMPEKGDGISVLVLDHHPVRPMPNVTYCNPRLFDAAAYIPVSYLAYQIYKNLIGGADACACWIAAAGTLGDYDISLCTDLFNELKGIHPELIGNFELSGGVLYEESLLGKIVKIIDSCRAVGGSTGVELVTRFLVAARDYRQLVDGTTPEAKEMLAFFERSESEIKRMVDDFKVNARRIGRIVFYEVVSPLKLKSTLATRIQRHSDSEVIVLAQKSGGIYNISLRRGPKSKVDLNSLIGRGVSNIPNSRGGGHEAAAGGTIPAGFLDTFLENLLADG